jgi:hypothetical protein
MWLCYCMHFECLVVNQIYPSFAVILLSIKNKHEFSSSVLLLESFRHYFELLVCI